MSFFLCECPVYEIMFTTDSISVICINGSECYDSLLTQHNTKLYSETVTLTYLLSLTQLKNNIKFQEIEMSLTNKSLIANLKVLLHSLTYRIL